MEAECLENAIPKKFIYCWFGKKPLSPLVERCIASWKKTNPDFELIRIDESNFDVHAHPFTKAMYEKGKWAFVSDYARLIALRDHGGIYLDTDMELQKNMEPLLPHTLLLGEESPGTISAGMIGATKNHSYILDTLEYYDKVSISTPETIPHLLTAVFTSHHYDDVLVCPPEYFYPYTAETISNYNPSLPPNTAYGVHLWNFSWGTWYQKLLHKNPLYWQGVKFLELLGLKKFIKKLLGLS